jgi:microsomal dipeptidase-like Zn-dependent dipeptidase
MWVRITPASAIDLLSCPPFESKFLVEVANPRTEELIKQDDCIKYMQVRTVEDFYKAKESGKYGAFHNYQGMMPLSASGDEKEALTNLQKAYELGVRQIMATYKVDSPYADGGVSHANVATLQPIDRNASDEAIKAVASTGGVIWVNFIGGFLNANGDSSAFSIAKHVEYIRNLTGPEHVCAGSDYVWNYADTLHWILRNPNDFPVECGHATPSHMGKPSEMWATARVSEETYGWTEDEIAGFLGENLVRFYGQVWK